MAKINEKYEAMIVFSAKLEDEGAALIEKFDGMIKDNAEEVEMNNWGKRKLAYEIHKQSEGYFCFIKADGEPSLAVELEKELRLRNETLLRYLIVRQGE